MRRLLNLALLFSFVLTLLVPLTGIHIHKLASAAFLLLCAVHIFCYRKKHSPKRTGLLLIFFCFLTGILGMILDAHTWMLALHKVFSMAVIFFLAIHLFVYRHKLT